MPVMMIAIHEMTTTIRKTIERTDRMIQWGKASSHLIRGSHRLTALSPSGYSKLNCTAYCSSVEGYSNPQKEEIGPHSGREPLRFHIQVEPSLRVFLTEQQHEHKRRKYCAAKPTYKVQNHAYRQYQDEPEQCLDPAARFGVLDRVLYRMRRRSRCVTPRCLRHGPFPAR